MRINFIEANKDILKNNLNTVHDGNTYFRITYNEIEKFNIKHKIF